MAENTIRRSSNYARNGTLSSKHTDTGWGVADFSRRAMLWSFRMHSGGQLVDIRLPHLPSWNGHLLSHLPLLLLCRFESSLSRASWSMNISRHSWRWLTFLGGRLWADMSNTIPRAPHDLPSTFILTLRHCLSEVVSIPRRGLRLLGTFIRRCYIPSQGRMTGEW